MNTNRRIYSAYIAVLLLSVIPLFIHLGAYPIQIWDESRLAVSAYEMMKSGDLLVTTFEGTPDGWNTKPPLLVWLQVLCFKIFGVGEFAFRLPSALAGLGIFLSIPYFFSKLKLSVIGSVAAVLLLIVSPRFVGFHALRAGDYDGLLVLFLTLQVIHFYLHIYSDDKKRSMSHLNWMLLFVALAVLTKSVSGLFFTPVFAVWWLADKQYKRHSTGKVILRCCLSLGTILIYYLAREAASPGYLVQVWMNDMGGRFSGEILQSGFANSYYPELFKNQTNGWAIITPVLLIPALLLSARNERKVLLYLLSCALGFFTIIFYSKTNTEWYNLPMLPLMAMMTALSSVIIIRKLAALMPFPALRPDVYFYILFIPLVMPYYQTIKRTLHQTEDVAKHESYYKVTNFLRTLLAESPDKNWKFYSREYSAHNWWYIMRMQDKVSAFSYTTNAEDIQLGDTVLCYESKALEKLQQTFLLDTLHESDYYIVVLKK